MQLPVVKRSGKWNALLNITGKCFFILTLWTVLLQARTRVKVGSETVQLEMIPVDGIEYIACDQIITVLGPFQKIFSTENQKIVYHWENHELVTAWGLYFYRLDSQSFTTLYPIQLQNGRILVALRDFKTFTHHLWHEWQLTLPLEFLSEQVNPNAPLEIRSVTLEKKLNGFLLQIEANRPFREQKDFDYSLSESYWINFNFFKAQTKLSEGVLKKSIDEPVVSIRMYDFNQSLQLSLRFRFLLENIQLKNDSLHNRLMLILRQPADSIPMTYMDITSDDSLSSQPIDTSSILQRHGDIKRIIIDAGHGGDDPGALGRLNTQEKNIVLDIALRLKKLLDQENVYEVILTRNRDEFVALDKRRRIANSSGGDLFVSIHCNSVGGARRNSARGIETYFLSMEKTDEARETAKLENSVIIFESESDQVLHTDTLKNIVFDMLHNSYLRESSDLANIILEELGKSVPSVPRKVDQAGFLILKGIYMPAILVEVGFISNLEEERNLLKANYLGQIALGLKRGIARFINRYH